ncbi:C40 family peptidase [Mycolicibacterium arenosum]|uniref:NlpC/P60 family protein n=1 Tax=Mycolicibacterium arenosum TaxID=2952157 RepID=A0ABT1MBF5_9MYCO|nr:C40 family peptidase [Mycolicibacterium sp. CAU 1645]MCP9276478.1 NlpC/P60 family protein [Mycolicibacterium sp. CAU 1645]
MGTARESFGAGASPAATTSDVAVPPTAFGDGAGRAADAFATESAVLDDHVRALSEHDAGGDDQLNAALDAAGNGRGRMDAVIDAAVADVTAMGASTNTPEGRAALIAAIKRHLEDTRGTLDTAAGDAATRAASAGVTAAGYDAVGNPTGTTAPATATPSVMPAMTPMPSMPAMPTMPSTPALPMSGGSLLSGLGGFPLSTLPAVPSQSTAASRPGGAGAPSADGSRGAQVVKRALSQLGVPYSWGGGGDGGPTRGSDGVGFDCSGLVKYAFAGAGVEVPRTTYDLQHAGVAVPPGQARPGDIMLCNYSSPGVPEHVQIVLSGTQTVEAPTRGSTVRIGHWPSGHFEIRRLV